LSPLPSGYLFNFLLFLSLLDHTHFHYQHGRSSRCTHRGDARSQLGALILGVLDSNRHLYVLPRKKTSLRLNCKLTNTGLMGWCCPCILFGKTQSRLEDPSLTNYSPINDNVRSSPTCHLIILSILSQPPTNPFIVYSA
jgi:hypothetical protein